MPTRVGSDLTQYCLKTLPQCRRADRNGDSSVILDRHPGIFESAASPAFDKVTDGDAVIAAIDHQALNLLFFVPAEFVKASLHDDTVCAVVEFRLPGAVETGHCRERTG